MSDRDERMMGKALLLAQQAADIGETPVGCVVARGDLVVGSGYNRRETDRNALAHAEIIAIDEACKTLGGWRLCGCDLFVTLEPCPMCAGAIINARLERVFFSVRDPKAGALLSRIELFERGFNHRPRIVGGLLAERSRELLTQFFAEIRREKQTKNSDGKEKPDDLIVY